MTYFDPAEVDAYAATRKRQSRRLTPKEQAGLLTLAQAATRLQITVDKMRTYLERYKIPSIFAHGKRWFEPTVIDTFEKPKRWAQVTPPGMLTAREAAARIGYHNSESVHTLLRLGKITCVRVGEGTKQRTYFDPKDVDAYAASPQRRPGRSGPKRPAQQEIDPPPPQP